MEAQKQVTGAFVSVARCHMSMRKVPDSWRGRTKPDGRTAFGDTPAKSRKRGGQSKSKTSQGDLGKVILVVCSMGSLANITSVNVVMMRDVRRLRDGPFQFFPPSPPSDPALHHTASSKNKAQLGGGDLRCVAVHLA